MDNSTQACHYVYVNCHKYARLRVLMKPENVNKPDSNVIKLLAPRNWRFSENYFIRKYQHFIFNFFIKRSMKLYNVEYKL